MLSMKNPKRQSRDNTVLPKGIEQYWSIEQINDTQYFLRLITPITQTGSDVTTIYNIPIHHRVMELYAYHYDASNALNTDAITFKWYTGDGGNYRLMFSETGVAYSSFGVNFMDEVNGGRDFNPGSYQFLTNTTTGHLVQISIRLEMIHK